MMDHYTIKLGRGGRNSEILKNGEPMHGVRAVQINGSVDELTRLTFEVYGTVDVEVDADAVEVTEIGHTERRYLKFPVDAT